MLESSKPTAALAIVATALAVAAWTTTTTSTQAATLFEGTHEGADLMTIHETADFRVPFRLQQDYRRRTVAAGTSHLLVQRAVRWAGHRSFDGIVRERAFDGLIAWMERGVVPQGDDVLAPDVSKLGLRWTPVPHPADPLAPHPR